MSLSTYIDYIHTLLPADQWEAYESSYTTWVTRAVTWSWHRPRWDVSSLLESQWRSFTKPKFAVSDTHMYVDREDRDIALWHHRAYQWGWYYIQESAASLPPSVIDYSPDDVILDMCAAPWGKTTQLATGLLALWGRWFVVANEIDKTRRRTLQETVTRMWLYNVAVSYRFSHWWAENYPSTFDHIVVDAVCSGEGTCFRTTDFMDQRGLGLTHKNAGIQQDIMRDAITCVKPWGTIVFSTCTLNTYENEWVVAWVLDNYADQVELVHVNIEWSSPWLSGHGLSDDDCHKVARLWPHIHRSWGFWVSKFRKLWHNSKPAKTIHYSAENNCGSRAMLKSQWWITLPEYTRIYEDKGIGYLTTTSKLTWYESGLPILKLWHGGIQPLPALVPALWYLSDLLRIDLNDEQIQQWMSSTEIPLPSGEGGEAGWGIGGGIKGRVIVTCHGFDVGLGKVGWWVLKNKMS